MPDLSKKVFHIETFFSSLTLQDLGALGPSMLLAPKSVLPDRQNSFVLSYISTTNISITINALSDTLSGAFPNDKNVSVTSEKTAPRNHQGMNFVGSILQHSTFSPGNLVVLFFKRAFSHHRQPLCNIFSSCCLPGRTHLGATNTEDPELLSPTKIWNIFWDKSGTCSGNVL